MEALNVRMKDLHRDELNKNGFDCCHPYVLIGVGIGIGLFAFKALLTMFGKRD